MHLGRLQKVDLREVWLSEPADFTPWLARADNLALLSETLGMELELVAQEQGVGPFRADIVCIDGVAESTVLIENQLERTDHRHLGQLLTYAAGLDAVTIVWIAHSFADEHRAALDWLNDNTGDLLRFFGLEVELWKIGDSNVAPKFNVVCKPNEWIKERSPTREVSDTGSLYIDYWRAFSTCLEGRGSRLSARAPGPRHHINMPIGKSGFHLAAVAVQRDGWIRAELYLGGRKAKGRFHWLLESREAIDHEFGPGLEWQELPERDASRIAVTRHDCDIEDRSAWNDQHQWLVDNLEKLDRTFRHLVASVPSDDSD